MRDREEESKERSSSKTRDNKKEGQKRPASLLFEATKEENEMK
jgi:hypothetical protein